MLRRDFAMARSAITVCFSDDLLSTLTNQSATLYDEIPYGFEHARLRKIDSATRCRQVNYRAAAKSCRKQLRRSTPKLIVGEWAEIVSGNAGNEAANAGAFFPIIHTLFSNIKAWLVGTHHGVSAKHLPRYLRERLPDPARCRMRHHHLRPTHGRHHARRGQPCPSASR